MSPEATPAKKQLTSTCIGVLSLQDLIAVAMTERELPEGFGDHLRHVASEVFCDNGRRDGLPIATPVRAPRNSKYIPRK